MIEDAAIITLKSTKSPSLSFRMVPKESTKKNIKKSNKKTKINLSLIPESAEVAVIKEIVINAVIAKFVFLDGS
jgi:hypothetical protein